MNRLTKNIVAFLVTFLATQACAMYIMGGFDLQTVASKLIAAFIGITLGMAVLAVTNGPE